MAQFLSPWCLTAAIAMACLVLPSAAMAQTSYTWTGSGNWNSPERWTPTGVPGPDDTASIGSGSVILNASAIVGSFNLSGGNLSGDPAAVLTVRHSGTWSGGTFANARLRIESDCNFILSGGEKTLQNSGGITNAGTVTWTDGPLNLENNVTFHNQTGALFDVQTDGLLLQNGGGTSTFLNEGTYQKSAGTGTNTIQIISFVNRGLLRVSSGTIRFNAISLTAIEPGNAFHAENDTAISFAHALGAYHFGDSVFSGPGIKSIAPSNGSAKVSGTIASTNLVFAAGDLQGTATLEGSLEWMGGAMRSQLTIPEGSMLRLSGSGPKSLVNTGTITNGGIVVWTGGQFNLDNNVTFHNQPGGLFDVVTDGVLIQNVGGTSTFKNEGTYRKSAGAGTNTVQIVSFVQSGVMEVRQGVVRVVGNWSPSAGSTLSTVVAGTNPGTEFGQFQVTGSVALAGNLNLVLAGGFSPRVGESFQVVLAGGRTGVFSAVTGGAVGNGLYFTPTYAANGVRLTVVDATPTFSNSAWSGGLFRALLHGVAGGTYQIGASTNLLDWETVGTSSIPGSGFAEFSDPESGAIPTRFYQAVFLP